MMTRIERDLELSYTPERLFGDDLIFMLPKREPARQVAQLVSRALTLNGDLAAYQDWRWRLAAAED